MDATFAAWLPFEMFHRIRDVNFFAIDPGFFKSAIHDFSGWSDERFAGHIFVIAGLLTDQHHRRFFGAFAENGLRCAFVQVTGRAIPRGLSHGREAR